MFVSLRWCVLCIGGDVAEAVGVFEEVWPVVQLFLNDAIFCTGGQLFVRQRFVPTTVPLIVPNRPKYTSCMTKMTRKSS